MTPLPAKDKHLASFSPSSVPILPYLSPITTPIFLMSFSASFFTYPWVSHFAVYGARWHGVFSWSVLTFLLNPECHYDILQDPPLAPTLFQKIRFTFPHSLYVKTDFDTVPHVNKYPTYFFSLNLSN